MARPSKCVLKLATCVTRCSRRATDPGDQIGCAIDCILDFTDCAIGELGGRQALILVAVRDLMKVAQLTREPIEEEAGEEEAETEERGKRR